MVESCFSSRNSGSSYTNNKFNVVCIYETTWVHIRDDLSTNRIEILYVHNPPVSANQTQKPLKWNLLKNPKQRIPQMTHDSAYFNDKYWNSFTSFYTVLASVLVLVLASVFLILFINNWSWRRLSDSKRSKAWTNVQLCVRQRETVCVDVDTQPTNLLHVVSFFLSSQTMCA